MEKYNNQYRIASAWAGWHPYDSGYYFGEIANSQMQLNELGGYVEE